MSRAFTQIKKLLTENIHDLTPTQKQELINWLKAGVYIGGGAKVDSDKITFAADDYLTYAVRHVLIKRKVLTPRSANSIIYRTIERLPKYSKDNQIIRGWIDEQFGKLDEVSKQRVGILLIAMLFTYLNRIPFYREHGVGPHELLSNIIRIPSAVEGELPGYTRSGLLPMILPKTTRRPRNKIKRVSNAK